MPKILIMPKIVICILVTLLSFFCPSDIMAQTNAKHLTSEEKDKLIKIQKLLRAYAGLKKFSGVALLAKDGIPFYKYTTGYANLDYSIFCALTTQFNLCDITQAFTALGVLKLEEAGQLKVTDAIDKYIPGIASKFDKPITIHQLLTHTSGVSNYYSKKEYISIKDFLQIEEFEDVLKIIVKYPLEFTPGSQYKPSASGYVLLANIIEKVSGMSYQAYLRETVLSPLDMEYSNFRFWHERVVNKAKGYKIVPKTQVLAASADFWGAFPFGSDALYCPIEDLLKFEQGMRGTALISQEYKGKMYEAHVTHSTGDINEQIGYGWKTKRVLDDSQIIYQNGMLDGLSTYISSLGHYTIIVFSNFHHNVARDLGEKLERIFYDENYLIASHPLAFFFEELIEEQGIDYVINNFDNILAKNNFELDRVWALNGLGQNYMKKQEYDKALAIFKVNQQRFPDENIVYDSTGECYLKLGRYDDARRCFRKRLSIMPRDKRSLAMLKLIEEEQRFAVMQAKKEAATKSPTEPTTDDKPEETTSENADIADDKPEETTSENADIADDKPEEAISENADIADIDSKPEETTSENLEENLTEVQLNPGEKIISTTITTKTTTTNIPPNNEEEPPSKSVNTTVETLESTSSSDQVATMPDVAEVADATEEQISVLKDGAAPEPTVAEKNETETLNTQDNHDHEHAHHDHDHAHHDHAHHDHAHHDHAQKPETANINGLKDEPMLGSDTEPLTAPLPESPPNANDPASIASPSSTPESESLPNNVIDISEETFSVFTVVEKMPEFPGGQKAIFSYLSKNMQYPKAAYESKLEGTVYVSFVVDIEGTLTNIRIKKGLSKGTASCDNEALRLVRNMPNWKPGYQRGEAVNVIYTLPIEFRIDEEE